MKQFRGAKKRGILIALAAALTLSMVGCGNKGPLDPKKPVTLTVWHYYNGSQQEIGRASCRERV